jgi:hypothetical protein
MYTLSNGSSGSWKVIGIAGVAGVLVAVLVVAFTSLHGSVAVLVDPPVVESRQATVFK